LGERRLLVYQFGRDVTFLIEGEMTPVAEQLEIRVNNIETTGLRLRRGMVGGYPSGEWAVLVEVPTLGYLELDDKPDFVIEIKDPNVPKRQRVWKRVTLGELVMWLQNMGVMGAR
jgi:hypothetical protein